VAKVYDANSFGKQGFWAAGSILETGRGRRLSHIPWRYHFNGHAGHIGWGVWILFDWRRAPKLF